VVVITKTDTVRGDKGVYETARDVAVVTGHVQITRPDGTQISGDIAQTDFKSNQSRILNSGHGRVRALLPQKTTEKATQKTPPPPKTPTPAVSDQNAASAQ
jgi:lipopolysaccharide assembly outer membrane protein LptD (OstA)